MLLIRTPCGTSRCRTVSSFLGGKSTLVMREHVLVSRSCVLRWLVSTASAWWGQPRGRIAGVWHGANRASRGGTRGLHAVGLSFL